ncbi:uncharacterized protein CTRU02_203146 [Colletotrichum truncatum]|uniref:Uncharacterized protein n=1 Tax=Colletotrichum truncatum TaxID=5467 RepID=A0ACC3Z8J6_COLTU|nr:uncharacterized protein CTRU02_08986 [Colletotrichum truncatum]KAF6789194.1 hypothetical protein CTRU02_08986 [Colletotrichum truncatum]
MNYSASSDIADKYKSLARGSNVIRPSAEFDQQEFINKNRKYAESLSDKLDKPLLKDYYIGKAADGGLCSAAVLQRLSTGSIPPATEDMVTVLSRVQGSAEVDNERDFLTWCSNLSTFFKKLKYVKNSKGLDLNNTQTFINYLLDNSGKINTKYKLFLILVFKDGTSHAIGLNLGTNRFFDPNSGIWDIEATKDDVKNIVYAIFGLEQIRNHHGNVVDVRAITYVDY